MNKPTKYFSAALTGISLTLASGHLAAENFTITIPSESNVSITHYIHQGKYSSAEGGFKMSQNNMHEETLWEKTKEMSAKAWEATKEGTAKAWDKTKELSSDAWEATKEGTSKAGSAVSETSEDAWDATKEGAAKAGDTISETSEDAWDATKDGSAKAWDKTKEVSADAWDATKEAAHDAKDAVTGDHYDDPMYNPERNTSHTYHQQHGNHN